MSIDQSTSLEEILRKWSISFKEGNSESSFGCQHDPKEYNGFAEQYEFCTKCDAKKINGEWQKSEKLQKIFDLF
jgi:hypothetical protein